MCISIDTTLLIKPQVMGLLKVSNCESYCSQGKSACLLLLNKTHIIETQSSLNKQAVNRHIELPTIIIATCKATDTAYHKSYATFTQGFELTSGPVGESGFNPPLKVDSNLD